MPRPSHARRLLRRIWIVVFSLHMLVKLSSQWWEIRYVADTHWNGPMISLTDDQIIYVNWGKPPPGAGPLWTHPGDDKGLSLRRNRYKDELAGLSNSPWVRPDSSPQFVYTFEHPRVRWRFRQSWLRLALIGIGVLLFRPPRPHPPGHCAECGYNLRGNTSGVCSECGEPTPAQAKSRGDDPIQMAEGP